MKSRQFFLWFCVCAAIPIVAAQLSLTMGWFAGAGINKGIWMDKEITLLPDITGDTNKVEKVDWRLVFVQPDTCDLQCEHALLTLQQLYSGLGRKQLKIKPLVIAAQHSSQQFSVLSQQQKKFPDVDWQLGEIPASELQNNIVIVNRQGLVLLRYPVTNEAEKMDDLAKNIRTDLLQLINYDRSGA